MIRSGRWIGAAAAAFFVLTGCGYRAVGTGSLPGGVTALCLSVPENRSSDVRLSPMVGDLVAARVISGGVDAQVGCDDGALLTGEIRSVVTATVSRDSAGDGIEERVTISALYRMSDQNGDVVWRSGVLSGDETYTVTPGGDSTAARSSALDMAARRLAEAVWSAMTQSF